jgi:cation diffusion facilitator family transporter
MSHPETGRRDHGHPHGHEHDHDHERSHRHADDDAHGHAHDHDDDHGLMARLRPLLRPHSHEPADQVDAALEASAEGMRTLWISLAVLGATACVQAVVTAASGSVALLGDTLHNAADALTAVPLAIAFLLARRPPTRRYTYGYGRAEDLAGIVIVATIAASSALAAYEAFNRLLHPRHVSDLVAVAVAALVGFAGNEVAARYRIRTGRKIGSAALIADGLHARTDGLTSLAVLIGAGGVAIGWNWADPVVGLLITVAILSVLRQAAREIYRRLMDAVDPALVDQAERTLRAADGVLGTGQVRLRWVGHQLRAECEVVVAADLSAAAAHQVTVTAEHDLLHAIPRLAAALVHADPDEAGKPDVDAHLVLADHRRNTAAAPAGAAHLRLGAERHGRLLARRPVPRVPDRHRVAGLLGERQLLQLHVGGGGLAVDLGDHVALLQARLRRRAPGHDAGHEQPALQARLRGRVGRDRQRLHAEVRVRHPPGGDDLVGDRLGDVHRNREAEPDAAG